MKKVTKDFQLFLEESDGVGQALMGTIQKAAEVSALDAKTHELAYIAVLSSLQMSGGISYHVKHAKELGASPEEVKSAVLVSLPLCGIRLAEAFATAVHSYEDED